jgi:hypothetical protein
MTKDEALRLALEALYGFIPYLPLEHDKPQCDRYDQAITAIKAALEAKDEPVATKNNDGVTLHLGWDDLPVGTKLYATPPQRTWVGLTYEDMVKLQKDLYDAKGESVLPTTFAMAVEAKLKARNI